MSTRAAKVDHEAFYQELVAVLRKRTDKLTSEEMLAIAANMLGKIIAMQDQRTMTRERALQIVAANIELGNEQVINRLGKSEGSA